jgi:hypothetical protein
MKDNDGRTRQALTIWQYAEKIHGIVPHGSGNPDEDDEDEELDIEASIRAEVAAMSNAPNKDGTRKAPKLFQPIFLDVQCVLFFRTQAPIEPLEFVERICNDALLEMADEGVEKKQRRCRFVNRLTPMQAIGRATEKGVEEVGRKVLGEVFELVEKTSDEEEKEKGTTEVGAKGNVVGSEGKAFSVSLISIATWRCATKSRSWVNSCLEQPFPQYPNSQHRAISPCIRNDTPHKFATFAKQDNSIQYVQQSVTTAPSNEV